MLPPVFGAYAPHSAVLNNTFADNGGSRLPFQAPLRGSFITLGKQELSAIIPSLLFAFCGLLIPFIAF
nr:MAG TPA: hypothetical protein [Caudoviricetes sp.]